MGRGRDPGKEAIAEESKPKRQPTAVTRRSLLSWAFRGNLGLQLLLLILILGVVGARVLPLEMQKRIINEAIVLRKMDRLLLYSLIYLLSVTLSGGLKLGINYLQAVIGERTILAMRQSLYRHILDLPLAFFRNTQPGMVVSALMTELSTAGTFIGMALAVPLSNILTLVAFAAYLLWLNPKLALVSLGIYPLVIFVVPWMQSRANRLNKQRVDQTRLASSQIAEAMTGMHEISVHGAYAQEERKLNRLVDRLCAIRIRWSLFRFGIKTVNNYFVGLGPIVVFLYGGYLVMHGQLELGAMVAFLSAQEKLYDPWKELIEFYQAWQDARVSYARTMHYFDAPGRISAAPATGPGTERLKGRIEVSDLACRTDEGTQLLEGVAFSLEPGEHLALVGFSGSGKSTLVRCIAKMMPYAGGEIILDGQEIASMTKEEIVANIGFVAQNPFIFTGTIRDNLLYAHRAVHDAGETAGADPYVPPVLDQLILVLQQAGLFVDVIRFGLDGRIGESDGEMADRVLRMRSRFQERFGQPLAEEIEFFTPDAYLHQASVLENMLFGTPTQPAEVLLETTGFRRMLEEKGLERDLIALGAALTERSGMGPVAVSDRPEPERMLLLALAFVVGSADEHLLPATVQTKIVALREVWRTRREEPPPGGALLFQTDAYIQNWSVFDNILFGRMRTSDDQSRDQVNQAIIQLLIEEDCLEAIADRGMDFQVGSMGDRLSGGQRQKLAIARVLLKEPQILLMDEATSALDNASQARIQALIAAKWRGMHTVVAVIHRLDLLGDFDKIGVMKSGKLMEFGTYEDLIANRGTLYELIHGRT